MVDTINNTQPVTPPSAPEAAPVEDIVTRVSKANAATPEAPQSPDVDTKLADLEKSVNTAFISPEELSQIKDPYARQFLENKQKEMLSGMNKKFQEVAELRKSLEQTQQQLSEKAQASNTWTKEKLQNALKDPNFASLAQELAQESAPQSWEGSEEQWSVLTDSEKQVFSQMQGEIRSLRQAQNLSNLAQTDARIKERLPDYDPNKVSDFEAKLMQGSVDDAQRRELIFKALNYEAAVQRAYDIAKEEKGGVISDKLSASSYDTSGSSQVNAQDIPPRDKKSSKQHFIDIAKARLSSLSK